VVRVEQEDAGRLELTVRSGAYIGLLTLAASALAIEPVDHSEVPNASSATAYHWQLPPGFPIPAVPADNPMSIRKVELGRRLFREQRLSATGAYACVSCHQTQRAYTDGRARALGATGSETRRSALSLANVAYSPALTWNDPTIVTLEAQMRRPLFNEHPIEMGLKGREVELVRWLSSDPGYRQQFAEAFAQETAPVSVMNAIKAIAAYERTLISGRSSFDRYVYDDDRGALSPGAKRGMALFYSARVGCAQCHFGLNFSGPIRIQGRARVTAIYADTGLYGARHGAYPRDDPGLAQVTHKASDVGRMRVPTLRNVALTAPYMHDGSIATLGEVIDHYAQGGRESLSGADARKHTVDPRIHAFQITVEEKSDLIAFLESLTDPEFVAQH
jgi:cytochrome c peroxidase